MLFHVIIHGVVWNPVPPIRWIADAATLINSADFTIDWQRLVNLARKHHLSLRLKTGLQYLHDRFHLSIPPAVMKTVINLPVSYLEKIEYRFMTNSRENESNSPYAAFCCHLCRFRRLNSGRGIIQRLHFPDLYNGDWMPVITVIFYIKAYESPRICFSPGLFTCATADVFIVIYFKKRIVDLCINRKKVKSNNRFFSARATISFFRQKTPAGEINFYYRIGNTTICLKFAGNELVPFLTPALEHLRLTGEPLPDLRSVSGTATQRMWRWFLRPAQKIVSPTGGDIWGFQQPSYKSGFSLDRMFC